MYMYMYKHNTMHVHVSTCSNVVELLHCDQHCSEVSLIIQEVHRLEYLQAQAKE